MQMSHGRETFVGYQPALTLDPAAQGKAACSKLARGEDLLPTPQGGSDSNTDAPLLVDGLARIAKGNVAAPKPIPPSTNVLYVNPTDEEMPAHQKELWEDEV